MEQPCKWLIVPVLLISQLDVCSFAWRVDSSGENTKPSQLKAPPRASKKSLQTLQGKWKTEFIGFAGEDMTTPAMSLPFGYPSEFVIRKNVATLLLPGRGKMNVTFRINARTSPREVDVIFKTGRSLRGIFALDSNTLLLCINNHPREKRPRTFRCSGTTDSPNLYIFRKID